MNDELQDLILRLTNKGFSLTFDGNDRVLRCEITDEMHLRSRVIRIERSCVEQANVGLLALHINRAIENGFAKNS